MKYENFSEAKRLYDNIENCKKDLSLYQRIKQNPNYFYVDLVISEDNGVGTGCRKLETISIKGKELELLLNSKIESTRIEMEANKLKLERM